MIYKKTIILVISVMPILAITGCRNNDTLPMEHSVTFTDDENYSISGITSGETFESGELVSFSVTSDSVFNTIESVSYNGEVITSNSDNYSFAMPDEDVTIEVRTSEVSEYDDSSDNLSWGKNVLSEISVAEDSSVTWEVEQELALDFGNAFEAYLGDVTCTIET